MAGAGYKLFNTGDVLTAAQVNTYLMQQTVMVFADASARTTALTGVVAEGMISFLKDTNSTEYYSGSAWVALGGASPINKNYLINGSYSVAQRATTFTAGANNDDAYTLDRWYILSDGNDVIDVTQDTTTIPTNGEYAIALDVETVAKKFGIATIIENKDILGLVGNTVTFSFKAKVSSTTKLDNVKAAIVAWSGTADSVTSDIISAWGAEGTNPTLIANATYENTPANLNLTTSYATYSVSAAVDTASTNNLILFIWSDVTDTTLGDFLYIAESKLELGSSATAFVHAGGSFSGELLACQRYFTKSYNQGTLPGTGDTAGKIRTYSGAESTGALGITVFIPPMRTAPTIVSYDDLGASGKCFKGGNGKDATIGSVSNNQVEVVCLDATNTREFYFYFTASAEL